jgi:hypothetical protein
VALGLPVTAIDAAEANWLTYRDSVTPAWNANSQHSTINRATWNSLTVLYHAALDAGDKAVSEEDAKRANWDQTVNRPPLITGESVTTDEFLRDPSVWAVTNDDTSCFTITSDGEGVYSSNAGVVRFIAHKVANMTPIDPNATYEVSIEVFEDGAGTATGTNYLGVRVVNASGVDIESDGSFWRYFKAATVNPSKGRWHRYSERIGKGTAYPFPAGATKFGLLVFLNYNNSDGVIQRVRRFKSRRVTDISWTSNTPNAWTLCDGKIINNVRTNTSGNWGQSAYSKAAIKGPQRFSFRWSRNATTDRIMAGLTETSAPVYYGNGAACLYHTGGVNHIQVYEAESFIADYPSETTIGTSEYCIEYDGVYLRTLRDGMPMGYSKFVGPDKTYRAFIDVSSFLCGISDVKHVSTQSVAVVGSNTFNSSGTLLGGSDLLNNTQRYDQVVLGFGRPENNADVTLTAQVTTIAPDDVTINATSGGVINAGQFPKTLTPGVTRGGVSARTDNRATYSATNITGGLVGNVTMNNISGSADKGRATIANATSSGTYQHNVFWDNILIASYLVRANVVAAAAPVGGGGSGGTGAKSGLFDVMGANIPNTSFNVIGQISNLTKSAGETIRGTASFFTYQYRSINGGSVAVLAKWQYSVAGANAWTDFGAAITGTASSWFPQDFSGNEGNVTVNQNVAPANGNYDLRLVCAASEGLGSGGDLFFIDGSAAINIGV